MQGGTLIARPPSGTVTFLFTDIEGSTQLWEHHHEWMERAHKTQEQIIRDAVARHNGYTYKMIGDAFQIAFATSRYALDAAIDAQRELNAWGKGEALDPLNPNGAQDSANASPLRVRMALHTGVTEERGDDYVGPALNRIARMLGAGHGGQILLSQTTYDLLRDYLLPDVTLRDLGEHFLKDLVRPEHIFQVVASELPSDFLPLKTLDTLPNNLPAQLTSFIGREREMAEIKRLLGTTRLLTLIGSGGAGKTRLSLQVAADVLEKYRDGVWFVELAAISDAGLVPQAIASALDVQEEQHHGVLHTLADYLKTRNSLLVLDNCEHLVDACAQVANALLHACPNLKILASSREGLGIAGEMTFRVPSLSLADPKHLPPLESLAQYEAIRLFNDRARAVASSFAMTNANAPAVTQICYRLDGIPLAIELAAARVKVLSVEQISQKLDDRFLLLTSGSRIALPRQQTLRAAMDWSYDLLPELERVLLRRLSVSAGSWSLEATEALTSGDALSPEYVLDLLTHLVDKSLVLEDEQKGMARYRMLQTIRQYAQEKLYESGERDQLWKRHLEYFCQLAEQAGPGLEGIAEESDWGDRLELEHDNLRVAMERSKSIEGGLELGLRLAGALL